MSVVPDFFHLMDAFGLTVRGGCDLCDADMEVARNPKRTWLLTVFHEETCADLVARRQASGLPYATNSEERPRSL